MITNLLIVVIAVVFLIAVFVRFIPIGLWYHL